MKSIIPALVVFSCVCSAAHAWNAPAHRTVAELVWRRMNPAERQAASDLLRQHPHYQVFLAAEVPAGVDTNEWVFLTAAVWPDWVRPAKAGQPAKPKSVTKYNVYPHGIGWPFVLPSDTNHLSLERFPIAKPKAELVLSNCLVTLHDRGASAHDRAVSLAWALHLYGDLHQPLHAANLVTQGRPNGNDLGGRMIVRDLQGNQTDLHAFWDRLLGLDFSYAAVARAADELQAAAEFQRDALPELRTATTIPAWVQESFRIAVTLGYAEERVQFVFPEALSSGKLPQAAVPQLKADYTRDAEQAARRRLALAAWRLGDALKPAWSE